MTDQMNEILFQQENGVAKITLNRPSALNSLTESMLDAFPKLLGRAVEDGARAVLITGAGRGFCAGAALAGGYTEKWEPRDLDQIVATRYSPIAQVMADLPIPIVTAINGPAAGAGASLALWGDIILASRSAYILFAFANIGLVPDAGGTWLLARAVGRVRSMEIALLAEKVPAEKAMDMGLVTRVIEPEELMPEAVKIAERLASRPTFALGLIRKQISAALDTDLPTTLALESIHQGRCGHSDDHAEGVSAFLEKRPAKFAGS